MTLLFRAFIPPALLLGLSVAWANGPAAKAEVATGRLKAIQAARELRVCIWPDYYGISYRNRKTLGLEGIDIDLARQLGQDLGVAVGFVDSSFVTLVADVEANRCDVAMFAIGITPQRAEKLRYTTPHLRSDIYAITTKSNRRIQTWADIDQPGVVVAVAKGTYHEPVMRARLKAATLLVVDTPQAREQEVAAGRADVFMTDYPFSRRMLDNVDWARLVMPPAPTTSRPTLGWSSQVTTPGSIGYKALCRPSRPTDGCWPPPSATAWSPSSTCKAARPPTQQHHDP